MTTKLEKNIENAEKEGWIYTEIFGSGEGDGTNKLSNIYKSIDIAKTKFIPQFYDFKVVFGAYLSFYKQTSKSKYYAIMCKKNAFGIEADLKNAVNNIFKETKAKKI